MDINYFLSFKLLILLILSVLIVVCSEDMLAPAIILLLEILLYL